MAKPENVCYTLNMNINKKAPDSLSKYLAQAGIASRRKVVDVIKSKVVTVNGVMINEPGFKVNPNDCVRVNDNLVRAESKIYILLNKPRNCITTVSDDLDRHGVMDLISKEIKSTSEYLEIAGDGVFKNKSNTQSQRNLAVTAAIYTELLDRTTLRQKQISTYSKNLIELRGKVS